MRNRREYERKYKRFVQGLISEDSFRQYLLLSLSKNDLADIIVLGAKSLRRAVAIGEVLETSRKMDSTLDTA